MYLPDFKSHSTWQVMGHSQEEAMLPTVCVCVCVCWGVPAAIYLWLGLSSTPWDLSGTRPSISAH